MRSAEQGVLTGRSFRSTDELLAAHGLSGVAEEALEHDGWSGARLTRLRHQGTSYVLKRTSLRWDWIARWTLDTGAREAQLAEAVASGSPIAERRDPVVAPYLGAAREPEHAAVLMPDLEGTLLRWSDPIDVPTLDRVLDGMAALHAGGPVADAVRGAAPCPLDRRLLLLSEPASHQYIEQGLPVGSVYLPGWQAFGDLAPQGAVDLIRSLAADPAPLTTALARPPRVPLHGDLKLGNIGPLDGGRVAFIDWQMLLVAPIAVELAWFLVGNVAVLPEPSAAVWQRYIAAARRHGVDLGDVDAQADLTWLAGLLLRGWRKGADTRDGLVYGSGISAADDLRCWCDRAVAAAQRRL
jgi:hypothetical protein